MPFFNQQLIATIIDTSTSNYADKVNSLVSPPLQRRISAAVALAMLIAIAGVLISPAVPSAPTLLPLSGLFLLGFVVFPYDAAVRMRWPTFARLGLAEPCRSGTGLDFVAAGLSLRR